MFHLPPTRHLPFLSGCVELNSCHAELFNSRSSINYLLTSNIIKKTRGVARRRPRGPGLNLKMVKKNPKTQIHFYTNSILSCSVEYCHFESLILASISDRSLHICVYTCIYDILPIADWMIMCTLIFLCEYHLVIINSRATKHILKIVEEIEQHQAWC